MPYHLAMPACESILSQGQPRTTEDGRDRPVTTNAILRSRRGGCAFCGDFPWRRARREGRSRRGSPAHDTRAAARGSSAMVAGQLRGSSVQGRFSTVEPSRNADEGGAMAQGPGRKGGERRQGWLGGGSRRASPRSPMRGGDVPLGGKPPAVGHAGRERLSLLR